MKKVWMIEYVRGYHTNMDDMFGNIFRKKLIPLNKL